MNVNLQSGDDLFEKMASQMGSMMDAMMDEMNSRHYFQSSGRASWDPDINFYELRERFLVCVDLAGMTLETIDVTVDKSVLHIRGDRPKPQRPELSGEVSVHLMEIDSGHFHRHLQIPGDVVAGRVSAVYSNGFLWIDLPRC